MAERKSGPVKPPVIDLKARDASQPNQAGAAAAKPAPAPKPASPRSRSDSKPESKAGAPSEIRSDPAPAPAPEAIVEKSAPTEAPAAEPRPEPVRPIPSPPAPPVRQAKLAMPWSAISIAAIGGALLGTALTYSLVNLVPMPSATPAIADPTEQLAALGDRLGALEGRIPAIEESALAAKVAIDGAVGQIVDANTGMAQLGKQIAEVQASIPAASSVDLGPIATQLDTLESRVTAIAAGASSADAAALADSLNAIEATVAALAERLDAADARLGEIDTIAADLATAKAAIAAQNQTLGGANIGPAIKLPLVVSGLETAFSAGRPYADELDSLRALLPDLVVPDAVSAAAPTGLTRADALANAVNAAIPAILAARAAQSTGDWGKDAIEWAKGLLALRPTGEMEGTSPDAIVSRLEAAVERHDFTAAAALLEQLPGPMQSAAGGVGADIRSHATADRFLAALRSQALAPVVEATP